MIGVTTVNFVIRRVWGFCVFRVFRYSRAGSWGGGVEELGVRPLALFRNASITCNTWSVCSGRGGGGSCRPQPLAFARNPGPQTLNPKP